MGTHKDLDVWKEAMEFVVQIYSLTHDIPNSEKYGLISQMQRAAISLPSNISEGAARQTTKEFIQFLYIALGSVSELETQLILVEKLGFAQTADYQQIANTIKSKLINLIKYLKTLK